MAGQTTGLQKTYITENEAVARCSAVTRGTAKGSCVIPTTDNAIPLGVVANDARLTVAPSAGGSQVGRDVAVQLSGIAETLISGNVAYGDRVILGTDGAVKRMPQNPGVAEVTSIKVITAPTSGGKLTFTLNGEDIEVTVAEEDTAAQAATKIKTAIAAEEAFGATAADDIVTVTAATKGFQIPPSFDDGETGTEVTIEVTALGKEEGNGSFNVLGFAEGSGTDGDTIPVNIQISHYYVP